MKKIKILSLITASTILMSGCSSINDNSYWGYQKNERKYGAITKQFDNAIVNGNIEWLEEILENNPGFDVNYCGNIMREYEQSGDYQHETIMIVSAEGIYCDEKLLEFLFKNGLEPNMNIRMAKNGNLLTLASKGTSMDLFNILLENNSDVNGNGNANSALYWAGRDSLNKTKILLEKGAQLNTELFDDFSYIGEEPLAMKYLIKYYKEKKGEPPLSNAEQYAALGESKLLIEELRGLPMLEKSQVRTVGDYILFCCNPEALQVFNELYPDYAIENITYKTFLKMITTDNIEMIKYCIENNYINTTDYCARGIGSKIIAYYASENNMEMCRYIIEKGVYDPNDAGIDLIDVAFDSNDMDTFTYLIELTDKLFGLNEYTFCFINSNIEWSEFTKTAIDYLKKEYGLTMLCIPLHCLDVQTAKYLYSNGKNIFPLDLQRAISMNNSEMVKLVLNNGANPNQSMYGNYFTRSSIDDKNFVYDTPYNEFISSDLAENDEWNQYVKSCLAHAISSSNSEIVQLLVDYGADVDNDYLLYRAIYDSSKATFDVLYNAGASLDYKNDEDKETLLDVAKRMGRDDIVKILKDAGVKAYKAL